MTTDKQTDKPTEKMKTEDPLTGATAALPRRHIWTTPIFVIMAHPKSETWRIFLSKQN